MRKTQKTIKNVANARRTGDEQATTAQRTRDEQATNRVLFVPIMENFRAYLRKDVANAPQIWLPIETNLIFRYEFAACSLQTRYIFVAILLYCGQRGTDQIIDNKRFLASCLNADARTVEKAIDELIFFGLLTERKIERKNREDTDRQKEAAHDAPVSVINSNLFSNPQTEEKEKISNNGHLSQFTLDDCKRYVEKEIESGATINNASALAMKLFKSGEADSFIRKSLFPDEQEKLDALAFGTPRQFTLDTCSVCFGAKMADVDGKGFRACPHCQNERGRATGYEPKGENAECRTNDSDSK